MTDRGEYRSGWIEGAAAFRAGRPEDANPYSHELSPARQRGWEDGWEDTRDQRVSAQYEGFPLTSGKKAR